MRFNDGFWLLKNGVKPFYGLQVVQVTQDETSYDLQVSTRPIRHRGDTLGGMYVVQVDRTSTDIELALLPTGPVLSVRVHSPTKDIIGVNIEHFASLDPHPNIQLFPDDPPIPNVTLSKEGPNHIISSGDLRAEVTENPYSITFKSPERTLTFAGAKHQAVFDVPSHWTTLSASNSSCLAHDPSSNPRPEPLPPVVRYINSELNLSPGELIYGFGEQFGAFVKNGTRYIRPCPIESDHPLSGQSIKVWNQDGGTSSEQAYKSVPFYITNRNYGVFINHPGEVEVEVGSEKVSRVGVSVADKSLEYFIIYGKTPLEVGNFS